MYFSDNDSYADKNENVKNYKKNLVNVHAVISSRLLNYAYIWALRIRCITGFQGRTPIK